MPTVLTVEGYGFFFYSNEGGEPPHIHVRKEEAQAKFWLGPVELSESTLFKPAQLRRLRQLVKEPEPVNKNKTKYFIDLAKNSPSLYPA